MYLGKVMEIADADELYRAPKHPYTRALMAAVPIPDPRLEKTRVKALAKGEVPSPLAAPGGVRFGRGASMRLGSAAVRSLALGDVGTARVACWRVGEI